MPTTRFTASHPSARVSAFAAEPSSLRVAFRLRQPAAARRASWQVVAMAALAISLPACGHRLGSGPDGWPDGVAPLPPGWSGEQMPARGEGGAAHWGVPTFEPPSATHCQGPQRVREQPGRDAQSLRRWGGAATLAEPRAAAKRADEARDAPRLADSLAASAAPGGLAHGEARAEAPVAPAPAAQAVRRAETVSAGMVDDNADFAAYQSFRARHGRINPRDRDSSERYRVLVRDSAGQPVADAEVALSWPGAPRALRFARTDGAGQAWLMPRLLLAPEMLAPLQGLELQARAPSGEVVRGPLQRGQKAALQLRLRQVQPAMARAPLDLVFLVDATGSMADEIDKLRSSLHTIADRVGALPSRPDLCWGLVAYRDRGDAFLTRTHDLTNDLGAFQRSLDRLQAAGGGDYPEALNEALDETVHHIDWRGAGTTRLVVLVADAPPHLDRGGPFHDEAAAAALARGIKLHAVGASGLDRQGEAVYRQLAQATGGRFVFLTYRDARHPGSGPGAQTLHDVRDYSVDTLDELIVRLVRDELEARPRS